MAETLIRISFHGRFDFHVATRITPLCPVLPWPRPRRPPTSAICRLLSWIDSGVLLAALTTLAYASPFPRFPPSPRSHRYLLGRFVVDRNDIVWHRQANRRHKRYSKNTSQLTRLKRWKPLASAYASKLRRLGFRERYWAPPNPQEVPGYHEQPGRVKITSTELRRRSAVPELNQTTGDPSLRQSWKVPGRQGLR